MAASYPADYSSRAVQVESGSTYHRLSVLGSDCVGKSSVIKRFVNGEFRNSYVPSIGHDVYDADIPGVGDEHRFRILDTPGFSRLESENLGMERPDPYWYLTSAELALLVYDITNKESFQSVGTFARDERQFRQITSVALVGTKEDLSIRREVEYEEAQSYALRNGYLFMEVSAKTGANVDDLFFKIGVIVLSHWLGRVRFQDVTVGERGVTEVLELSYLGLERLPTHVIARNVTQINLSHNKLVYLPVKFRDFINLTHLLVNNNNLSSLPTTFKQLKKLQVLDLRNNKLKRLSKDIAALKILERLYVEGNPLTVEDIRSLLELMEKRQRLMIDIADVAPAEIRAQGERAKLLYQKALRDGSINVYRGRILLIGQERAGKTSLKKSLLGLPFDPKEESTDGIAVDPSKCEVEVDQIKTWQSTSEKSTVLSDVCRDVSRLLAEERYLEILSVVKQDSSMKESKMESVGSADAGFPMMKVFKDAGGFKKTDVSFPERKLQVETRIDKDLDDRTNGAKKSELRIDAASPLDDVTSHANECLKHMLLRGQQAVSDDNDQGSMVTVDLWDFAGQHLYYASHPVFLSSRAVYILVHNLSKPLNAPAEPCVRQGTHDVILENPNGETNLENLLSWLVTVHRMKPVGEEIVDNAEGKLPYLRPPVFVVGTHADKPFEEIKTITSQIQQSISGKESESHVIRPLFSVDNTQSKRSLSSWIKKLFRQDPHRRQQTGQEDDTDRGGVGIDALRARIMEVLRSEPYMGEKIPVRWLNFEKVIESLVAQNICHTNVEQLQIYAKELCYIDDDDEFHIMLKFYHDLGLVVRHQSTVVLKAQWLIDLFRHLITIPRFDKVEPLHSKYWQEVERSGVLSMELVDHVFSKFIQQSVVKEDILDMMEQFGLIAKFSSTATDATYFVPAQLKTPPEGLCKQEPSMSDPCPLYLHFVDGFVPHGLFTRLVSRSISWYCESWRPLLPKLYQNGAWFVLIKREVVYDLILLCKKSFIKIVLKQRGQDEAVSMETSAGIARRVLVFVEDTLQNLSRELPYLSGLQYELCVACPYCARECTNQVPSTDEDCLHLLEVKRGEQLICMKSVRLDKVYTVHGVEKWFSKRMTQDLHTSTLPCTFQGAAAQSDLGTSDKALKVTLLASEWGSSMGGLSTINRKLAILLAKNAQVNVTLLVPQFACCEEDKRTAASHNVVIREALRRPGYNDPLDWLSFPPRDLAIDIVLGNGAKLGKQAQVIREYHGCKWAQVVHTTPEELGMYKNYPKAIAKGEEKNRAEVDLCKLADLVVTVGPKLAEAYSSYLRSCKKQQDIFQLTPGTFHEFSTTEQAAHEGKKFKVLTFGRGDAEDFSLKGYDIAAKAVAELKDSSYCLVFVGAPDGKQEEVAANLLLSGLSKDQLIVRTFVQSKERLNDLFCEVDLAIMPSRTEGFGLTALEALSAGLPILVSGNSGFGVALRDLPSGESFVVDSGDPEEWAKAIASVRQKGRTQRLQEFQMLRTTYEKTYNWEEQCEALVEKMLSIACEGKYK